MAARPSWRGQIRLHALLADQGFETFPILSGGKGIHVIAPPDASAAWPRVKSFADQFTGAPVAAPVNWSELDEISGVNAFTIRDADQLLERARSKLLAGWGVANQALPDF